MATHVGCTIGKITIPESGDCLVDLTYPNPDPPPAEIEITVKCDKDRAREMLTAKAGGLLCNVTEDGTTPVPAVTAVEYP